MNTRNTLALGILVALSTLATGAQAQESAVKKDAATDEQEATTLDSVVVQGKYIETGSRSAMKIDASILDTPFSVSSYSEAFMDDIGSSSVADLYKYMTGIQRAGNTAQDISIRGFKTGGNDRNAMMVDGLPGLSGRFGSPPTIGVQHIDVVRGPASVLYGQAQPGGFVNIITKKPQAKAAAALHLRGSTFAGDEVGFGDATGYEAGMDFTGPIDGQGRFLYRFIAQKNDADTFRDYGYNEGIYVAPSLTWNLGDATAATLALEYRASETAYDKYLSAPLKDIHLVAPITTYYHQPGDYQEEIGKTATLMVAHSFESGAALNFSTRVVDTVDRVNAFDVVSVRPNLVSLARRAVRNENRRESAFFDMNLSLPFATGSMEHKLLAGVSGGRDSRDLNRLQFFNGPATGPQSLDISIYDPVYGGTPTRESLPLVNPATPNNLTHRYTESEALGLYVADLVTLSEKWKLNLGLRSTYDKQDIEELRIANVPSTSKSSRKILPSLGLLFQPTGQWTIYSSYSTSYVPPAATVQDVTGRNSFDPESSTQLELGTKAELFDGRVQATLAAYRIEKDDAISSFSCPIGTCSVQIGAERSQGVEFEVDARITDDWQVTFGTALMDAEITRSRDPAQVGAKLANSADTSVHLWTRYDIPRGWLAGLGVGVGVAYLSDRAGNIPSSADSRVLDLPAYTVVDLGLYYTYKSAQFDLRFNNALDEHYYESTALVAENEIQPGAPRNVALTVRYNF